MTTTAARSATEGFVLVDTVTRGLPHVFSVPTLVLLDRDDSPRLSWINPTIGAIRVVVVPDDMDDPEKIGQKIRDYRSPTWDLHDFLKRI